MQFTSVYDLNARSEDLLYKLLDERPPEANISHKEMPSVWDHRLFIAAKPYHAWYIIEEDEESVGAIYLSKTNEIGIGILKEYQGRGFGSKAIKKLMRKHEGPFLANIAPHNGRSMHLFEKMGFRLVQCTYESG